MALSGTITNGIHSNHYRLKLEWTATQSIANNTSTITVKTYFEQDRTWSIELGNRTGNYVQIGSDKKSFSANYSNPATSAVSTLINTSTFTVQHDSSGAASVTLTGYADLRATISGTYYAGITTTGTITLDTIPRTSSLSLQASSYAIGSSSGTFSFTVTSKANFYHKASWSCGSYSASNQTLGAINATSKTFTNITLANLLNGLPNTASGTLKVTVETYSDSGYTNLVGSVSASASISVNLNSIKPSITLGNIANNNTIVGTNLVAGYSTAKISSTTTKSYGAGSVTTTYTISRGTLNTTSSTSTSAVNVVTGTLPSSTSDYTFTITATAKDSRGATATATKTSGTVYGYTTPKVTINAYRTASNTSTARDDGGLYVYVTYTSAVGASVNGANSIQSTSVSYSGSVSGTISSSGTWIALGETQSATFTITATDKVATSTASTTVSVASLPFSLYDNGSGTVGAAFGGVAVGNWVTSYINVRSIKNDGGFTAFSADQTYGARTWVGSGGVNRGLFISGGDTAGWLIYADASKNNLAAVTMLGDITAGNYRFVSSGTGNWLNMITGNAGSAVVKTNTTGTSALGSLPMADGGRVLIGATNTNDSTYIVSLAVYANSTRISSGNNGSDAWLRWRVSDNTLYAGINGDGSTSATQGRIKLIGSAKSIQGDGRLASANIAYDATNTSGQVLYFLATSSMTEGKPAGDASILNLGWDNAGYDMQLAAIHASSPTLQIRYKGSAANAWQAPWLYVDSAYNWAHVRLNADKSVTSSAAYVTTWASVRASGNLTANASGVTVGEGINYIKATVGVQLTGAGTTDFNLGISVNGSMQSGTTITSGGTANRYVSRTFVLVVSQGDVISIGVSGAGTMKATNTSLTVEAMA